MSYETKNAPDRELDWDEEISNDGGYTLLPEGDYPFTVIGMERARYEGSAKVPPCRMAKLSIALHGGSQGEGSATVRLFLLSRFQWKIAELFVSLGLAKADDETVRMQWDKVEGGTGLCHVTVQEYTKKSGPNAGETGQSNEITKFLPPPVPKAAPAPAWKQGAF